MTTRGFERSKGRRASFGRAEQRPLTGRLAPEAGFTLIELLVAVLLSMIMLGAASALFITGQVDATSAIARADAVAIANAGLREMDQDFRQAYQVEYPTSTSHSTTGCTAVTSGTQLCNQLDVLARSGSGTDYEVRYDCTVASTTVGGDRSCWRYQCSASASTGSGSSCLATSGGVAARLVIDDLINGTSSSQAFSLVYASGATRASSGTVTIKVPAAATLSKASNGDQATVVLQDGIFMPNLSIGQ